MKPVTAVVIEDERLVRQEFVRMLRRFPTVNVIGEASDVREAVRIISETKPDVIFLDIQMPGETGFDLFNKIEFQGEVVFVTAYDQYALRAFEVNALDYLLKPVSEERLAKSITRLTEKVPLTLPSGGSFNIDDSLFLLVGNQMRFIRIDTIIYIRAETDYTYINTTPGYNGLVLKTMSEWERRLPETCFCRIHRSFIINLKYVEKIEKWFNYDYRVFMTGVQEPLIMSRRYAKKIREKRG